ncbi:hypothetical protein [Pelagicoccus sp. SDUM812003]|uniref:hypothetical protein n=1 Tax=Pelagicoccus sp. SDUM812003 TaxID=3041267 RepID=UPI00280F5539|nr:hypothetical protein [Pelagicoccus sp. SDUM812003]MDQ8201967.1 hypothetical protein [Pelagicoccus sp. SDUM812003]
MNESPSIDKRKAQLLMTQLMDGELSAADADRLERYLKQHPEEIDWMESADLLRQLHQECQATTIAKETIQEADTGGTLLSFASYLRPLAAAAAIAIVGVAAWIGFDQTESASASIEPAVVEFVSTDLPDASTFVYSDEESGWTVVWVETDNAPKTEDHG